MKSILIETIGTAVACAACLVFFCGLQCVILSAYFYKTVVGSDA